MLVKTLPHDVLLRLIEGEEDVVTPAAQKESRTRATTPCPRCMGHFRQKLDPGRAFSPDRILPRFFHECAECGYTVDPETNFVIAMGNPGKAVDPFKLNTEDS